MIQDTPKEWYIGFLGDHDERPRAWFDIFTCPQFRHCFAMAYDPLNQVWIYYDTSMGGSEIIIYPRDDQMVTTIIAFVAQRGCWLKFKKQKYVFKTGCWRLYCVPAIKFILSFKSSALRPKALYRDLVRAGAQPVFNKYDNKDDNNGKSI